MTTLLYNYNGRALLTMQSTAIPRIGDNVDLKDKKYVSRSDNGMRKYKVAEVTHKPASRQVVIDVDYVGFPNF